MRERPARIRQLEEALRTELGSTASVTSELIAAGIRSVSVDSVQRRRRTRGLLE